MAEVAISQLPDSVRSLALKARQAAERGDADLATDLSWQVLASVPNCLAVWEMMFDAQFKLRGEAKAGWGAKLSGMMPGRGKQKLDTPTLGGAVEMLRRDFHREEGWKHLAAAAGRDGSVDLECWARSARARLHPTSKSAWVDLANGLLERDRAGEAVTALQQARSRHPHDAALEALAQRAAVAQTVSDGKWEEQGDFRSKLRRPED